MHFCQWTQQKMTHWTLLIIMILITDAWYKLFILTGPPLQKARGLKISHLIFSKTHGFKWHSEPRGKLMFRKQAWTDLSHSNQAIYNDSVRLIVITLAALVKASMKPNYNASKGQVLDATRVKITECDRHHSFSFLFECQLLSDCKQGLAAHLFTLPFEFLARKQDSYSVRKWEVPQMYYTDVQFFSEVTVIIWIKSFHWYLLYIPYPLTFFNILQW